MTSSVGEDATVAGLLASDPEVWDEEEAYGSARSPQGTPTRRGSARLRIVAVFAGVVLLAAPAALSGGSFSPNLGAVAGDVSDAVELIGEDEAIDGINCGVDVAQAVWRLANAATNIKGAEGLHCEELLESDDLEQKRRCLDVISGIIYNFIFVIAMVSQAVSNCARTLNVPAACSASVTGMVANLGVVAGVASGASNTCKAWLETSQGFQFPRGLTDSAAPDTDLVALRQRLETLRGNLSSSISEKEGLLHSLPPDVASAAEATILAGRRLAGKADADARQMLSVNAGPAPEAKPITKPVAANVRAAAAAKLKDHHGKRNINGVSDDLRSRTSPAGAAVGSSPQPEVAGATVDIPSKELLWPQSGKASNVTALPQEDQLPFKELRALSGSMNSSQLNARRTEAVKCWIATGQGSAFLIRSAMIILQSAKKCNPQAFLENGQRGKRLCATDIIGLLGGLGLASRFLSLAVVACGSVSDEHLLPSAQKSRTRCAADISGIAAGVFAATAPAMNLKDTCGRLVDGKGPPIGGDPAEVSPVLPDGRRLFDDHSADPSSEFGRAATGA